MEMDDVDTCYTRRGSTRQMLCSVEHTVSRHISEERRRNSIHPDVHVEGRAGSNPDKNSGIEGVY